MNCEGVNSALRLVCKETGVDWEQDGNPRLLSANASALGPFGQDLANPADGRKRFRGTLLGLDGNNVMIDVQGSRLNFPFASIAEAKLILTDKLINEDLKARKSRD